MVLWGHFSNVATTDSPDICPCVNAAAASEVSGLIATETCKKQPTKEIQTQGVHVTLETRLIGKFLRRVTYLAVVCFCDDGRGGAGLALHTVLQAQVQSLRGTLEGTCQKAGRSKRRGAEDLVGKPRSTLLQLARTTRAGSSQKSKGTGL